MSEVIVSVPTKKEYPYPSSLKLVVSIWEDNLHQTLIPRLLSSSKDRSLGILETWKLAGTSASVVELAHLALLPMPLPNN